jgi:hypothetical protein
MDPGPSPSLTLLTLPSQTLAVPIVDQINSNIAYDFNADFPYNWQQTVIVGVPGQLVGIDLYKDVRGSQINFYLNNGPGWQSDPNDFQSFVSLTTPPCSFLVLVWLGW